ncbi:MOV10 [Lepeophtheirus salmonis]|uniref:MOV10 n=1 Tax=Lepeophtheirus salmonis TaxID=72036 RepID=A0A7R8CF75_LEPSM|nr:MOV10 [Lepeophtheirus salmonis]CAF2763821.1 MOV10 [Lepeophtheirus salmonis]
MIEHILGFSSYPFPYIIFGPPGTGKSSTVAEAIKQVHHDPKKTRILVCAPSNTAVDVVTEKILDDISPCSVLHVVAARHKEKYDSKTGPFKESLQIGGSEWQIVNWIVCNKDKSFVILSTSVMGYVVSKMQ